MCAPKKAEQLRASPEALYWATVKITHKNSKSTGHVWPPNQRQSTSPRMVSLKKMSTLAAFVLTRSTPNRKKRSKMPVTLCCWPLNGRTCHKHNSHRSTPHIPAATICCPVSESTIDTTPRVRAARSRISRVSTTQRALRKITNWVARKAKPEESKMQPTTMWAPLSKEWVMKRCLIGLRQVSMQV